MNVYKTKEEAQRENVDGVVLPVDGGYAVFW